MCNSHHLCSLTGAMSGQTQTEPATDSTNTDHSTFDRRVVTLDYTNVFESPDTCAHPDCNANPETTDNPHHLYLGGDVRAAACDLGVATFCSATCCGDFAANLPCQWADPDHHQGGIIDPVRDLQAALELGAEQIAARENPY
ncbi:MAG: hypothetical protein ACI8U4_000472 [Natronomonas sp.]|jgi:hypothetical protein